MLGKQFVRAAWFAVALSELPASIVRARWNSARTEGAHARNATAARLG